MAYSKTNWQNLPTQTTPINSSNLNKIENGIADSYNSIGVDAYDNTSTYAVGDYCIYNNTLYRCTTAIQSAEEWTLAHWTATSVNNTQKQVDKMALVTVENWADKSVASSTTTNVGSIEVPANQTYMLIATVGFPSNSTGFRQVGISLNNSSANKDRHSIVRQPATSGVQTNVQLVNIVNPNTTTTFYVNVYQNSGSSLTVTSGLIAVRLK